MKSFMIGLCLTFAAVNANAITSYYSGKTVATGQSLNIINSVELLISENNDELHVCSIDVSYDNREFVQSYHLEIKDSKTDSLKDLIMNGEKVGFYRKDFFRFQVNDENENQFYRSIEFKSYESEPFVRIGKVVEAPFYGWYTANAESQTQPSENMKKFCDLYH